MWLTKGLRSTTHLRNRFILQLLALIICRRAESAPSGAKPDGAHVPIGIRVLQGVRRKAADVRNGSEADMRGRICDVRSPLKADIRLHIRHVRWLSDNCIVAKFSLFNRLVGELLKPDTSSSNSPLCSTVLGCRAARADSAHGKPVLQTALGPQGVQSARNLQW